MRILLATILLLSVACADEKKPATTPPSEPSAGELPATAVEPEPAPVDPAAEPKAEEPAEEPAAVEVPPEPEDDPKLEDCMEDCMQRNQMRSVAPEQIERDCKAECSGK